MIASSDLPRGWFARIANSPDPVFYEQPRFVQHIDDSAITALTDLLLQRIPAGADVLDLMSSWVSHLPQGDELSLGRVAGLGLNAAELAANPRLTEWSVVDLNRTDRLPFDDAAFDVVLITVSIQYLTRPGETMREIGRVLRPNGCVIVSFSNRMFPTKAVRIWQETPDARRSGLVAHYLEMAGGFAAIEVIQPTAATPPGGGSDPLWVVIGLRDPDARGDLAEDRANAP